ncbi:TetR/AcrR family transcriptional regulator [Arthrobacter sp. ISL-28]|uniref:TetR/AcrR family transcriptional regulator n=1 Tax=Arthrobacter sp. ISL-28 TaxID=2819108 RepID=UPI001BEB8CE5|nr:TetR/AcrR family transcriptional regulator [Arthrobacter sp. ISL-28]MBT2521546.1 TetR/AcrR family transcriptional regulator [Arthrobacter sp. ISL-28]
MDTGTVNSGEQVDRQSRILEAALELLSRHGISGVNMRAVAREAGVALGLVNYYYEDKSSLIRAALHRIDEHDLMLVEPDPASPPDEQLRKALRRVANPELLTTRYLSLRLHLWALAQAHEDFALINAAAFERYLDGLAALIGNAKPELSRDECRERAADVVVVQNGMWLTALLGVDKASIQRSIARTEQIAFAASQENGHGLGARSH